MKAFILIVLMTSVAFGQGEMPADPTQLTEAQYKEIANRFSTTIKETQVDTQLIAAPEIRDIVTTNKITPEDINGTSGTSTDDKRKAAKDKFKEKFANFSDDQIKDLEKKLQLETYGLIPGKDRQTIMNYFADRIEKSLYGVGTQGETMRMKDKKYVDHKVYNDLYKSQLGKSILLELSNYCYNTLHDKNATSTDHLQKWEVLANSKCNVKVGEREKMVDCVKELSDVPLTSASPNPNTKPDPYKDLSQKLDQVGKPFLENFMAQCSKAIPYMCSLQTYCKASVEERKTLEEGDAFLKKLGSSDCGKIISDKIGVESCVVQTKLKAFRINIQLTQQIEKTLQDDYKGGKQQIGLKLLPKDQTMYAPNSNDADSIEGITTISSQDTDQILSDNSKKDSEEFIKKGCEQNPEKPECSAYYYSEKDQERFQNSSLIYVAATELEKKKIDLLKDSDDDLKKYLTEKGYADLVGKVGTPELDNKKIVEIAKARFEAERDASFKTMEAAFGDRQVSNKNDPKNASKAQNVKDSITQKGKKLTELIAFNNVISSYLKIDLGNGKEQVNSRALKNEAEKIAQAGSKVDQGAAAFFKGLGTGVGEMDSSNGSNNGTSIVNESFIDSILGDVAQKTSQPKP